MNDASRDRTREIFAESLAVCVTEDESIAPESLATIAGQIESAMSAKWPDGGRISKPRFDNSVLTFETPRIRIYGPAWRAVRSPRTY